MKRVAFTAAVGSGPPGGGPEIGMNTRPPNGEGGKMLVTERVARVMRSDRENETAEANR